MYRLETSTGFRTETSTVEQVASALAGLMRHEPAAPGVSWTVVTPHGTTVTAGDLRISSGAAAADADTQIDRAYALLVRDHLTRGRDTGATGLFHTTR